MNEVESISSNLKEMTYDQNDKVFQNVEDPGEWPHSLSVRERDTIIEKGPNEIFNYDFPIKISDSERKRKFSVDYFYRTLSNGEKVGCRWFVYSKKKDVVYCFCCKLFGNACNSGLVDDGLKIGNILQRE
ncbi:zinc finger MYM-type protein 5-like [Sipha flava]|uniref:Zinc finger MYM-type protein 5-like n=1 Tax=Sipha flava TaxID=143950 RepID=A0A8B8GQI9_9HEMI|nr:zinc finger MYM-type protein 5-like [Sipha flava]